MKKILVIGGSGFLGAYIVDELDQRNYDVTVADIKKSKSSIKYIKCDILNNDDLEFAFSHNFDYVYNFAALANLDDANKNPIKTLELNLLANMKIVELCIKNNIKKYIFSSSAYAMSEKGSFYGVSKLAAEKSIEQYHKKYGLDFIIIRYGSVYSEKDFNNNYVYNLIKEAVKNNTIIHNGDGNEYREYIHAIDASKLSVDVLENEDYTNKHIILTGSQGIKRKDLFNMINEILGDKLEIKLNKDSKNDHYKFTPYSFQPSISRKLSPNPQIDLGQGILEIIRNVNDKK